MKGVIRNPKRTEKGIAPKTVAVMQPVSPKAVEGKVTWKQELWVMYVRQGSGRRVQGGVTQRLVPQSLPINSIRIISAWRYPGISPKRSPIPEEIWQELENGGILEEE